MKFQQRGGSRPTVALKHCPAPGAAAAVVTEWLLRCCRGKKSIKCPKRSKVLFH